MTGCNSHWVCERIHTRFPRSAQHLRAVIDRDSTLEKQARQALQHCLARDGGSQQELEAERLMLLAGKLIMYVLHMCFICKKFHSALAHFDMGHIILNRRRVSL